MEGEVKSAEPTCVSIGTRFSKCQEHPAGPLTPQLALSWGGELHLKQDGASVRGWVDLFTTGVSKKQLEMHEFRLSC